MSNLHYEPRHNVAVVNQDHLPNPDPYPGDPGWEGWLHGIHRMLRAGFSRNARPFVYFFGVCALAISSPFLQQENRPLASHANISVFTPPIRS
jgi:hypothetical protein